MLSIRTVTVIGSTGTMGTNVADIFDLFGNVKVYCGHPVCAFSARMFWICTSRS